ncbi:MAG TPA: alanine racemase [bacterium]|jgi:alanine racemase
MLPPLAGPEARIDLAALARNAALIQQKVGTRGVLAVVKWNAYGHGLIPCSKTLDAAGITGFGVSSPQDGVTLRKAGITKPILVMTDWVGKPPHLFLDWDLQAAATSWYKVEYLESVSRTLGRSIPTHIKFDTGLGRVGVHHSEASAALQKIARMKHLHVVGLYSHLAYGGPQDAEQGRQQIAIFDQIVRQAAQLGLNPDWIHIANSAAALALPDVPGNLVRTGIALYGQPPSPQVHNLLPLEPVMTLLGRVKLVRRVKRGHGFPTTHFWTAPLDGWGAEVNLGHRINYARSLAGKAQVLVQGTRRPLVGVITPDTSYVFVAGADRPHIGDEVVFWGRQGGETLFLFEVAPLIGALAYELPTWLSARLPRVFQTAPDVAFRA